MQLFVCILLQGSNPKFNFLGDVPRNPTRVDCMQIKQEIERKNYPLEKREKMLEVRGGDKRRRQVVRLEPSLGKRREKVG